MIRKISTKALFLLFTSGEKNTKGGDEGFTFLGKFDSSKQRYIFRLKKSFTGIFGTCVYRKFS